MTVIIRMVGLAIGLLVISSMFVQVYGVTLLDRLFGEKVNERGLTETEEKEYRIQKETIILTLQQQESEIASSWEIREIVEKVFSEPVIIQEFKRTYKETNGMTEGWLIQKEWRQLVVTQIIDELIPLTTNPFAKSLLEQMRQQLLFN
jgi:hypothetical protein